MPDPLKDSIYHSFQLFLFLRILCKGPGLFRINKLVQHPQELPDLSQCLLEGKNIKMRFQPERYLGCPVSYLSLKSHGLRHNPVEVTEGHGQGSAYEVAKVVCQVTVNPAYDRRLGKISIQPEGDLPEEEIPELINSVLLRYLEGVHHIPEGFGHLLPVNGPPAMGKDIAGQFHPQGHEHG